MHFAIFFNLHRSLAFQGRYKFIFWKWINGKDTALYWHKLYTLKFLQIYMYMCMCVCVYTCTHAHTHTRARARARKFKILVHSNVTFLFFTIMYQYVFNKSASCKIGIRNKFVWQIILTQNQISVKVSSLWDGNETYRRERPTLNQLHAIVQWTL